MTTRPVVLAGLAAAALMTISAGAQQAVPPENAALPEMPKQTTRTGKHVNRVIDMWLKNQPVYYAQISGGGYEQGKQMATTKADYITYEMEHGPLDFKELREFMRGLLDAGPTRTGHKTPAVIVTLPIAGTTDALRARSNTSFTEPIRISMSRCSRLSAKSGACTSMLLPPSRSASREAR